GGRERRGWAGGAGRGGGGGWWGGVGVGRGGVAISPLYDSKSSGVLITGLVNGGAAQNNNVASWSVLVAVNGTTVNSVESLRNVLSPLTPRHHLLLTIHHAASNPHTPYSIITKT